MTNAEIIITSMLLADLDPEEVVVNTFAGWKRKGYQVKRGEKAVFNTKIWKPTKRKLTDEQIKEILESGQDTDGFTSNMYLVNASFFTDSQVEKIDSKTA